jgi:hypothetical protein
VTLQTGKQAIKGVKPLVLLLQASRRGSNASGSIAAIGFISQVSVPAPHLVRFHAPALTLGTLFFIVPSGFGQSPLDRDYSNTMQQVQIYKEAVETVDHIDLAASADLPPCCGTGCAVCVLDYPELFSNRPASNQQADDQVDSEMLAMLEAIEQAQSRANQIITETSEVL